VSFEADQRFSYQIEPVMKLMGGATVGGDMASLVSDPDNGVASQVNLSVPPLKIEVGPANMAFNDLKGKFDNYHEKDAATGNIYIPSCNGALGGNFKCHHIHWRWFGPGPFGVDGSGPFFGNGKLLVPSSQRVDLFVVLGRGTETKPPGGIEENTNRPGADYKNFVSPDFGSCQATCAGDPKCQALTFVKPGVKKATGHCWLKHAVPGASSNSCCRSWVRALGSFDPASLANGETIAPVAGKGTNLVLWVRTISNPGTGKNSAYGPAWNAIADAMNYKNHWFVR
jgi:hypothetical protein